jgi:hypothetical protein
MQTPKFNAAAREQARKNAQLAIMSTIEHKAYTRYKTATEGRLSAQLEEVFAKKCEEFSGQLEHQLESFYEQTASRLDVLSHEVVQHFSETLEQRMKEGLNTLMADWAQQNRALVNAECHVALERFASRLEKISSSCLDSHRKEIQTLSLNLKNRLRGVARTLEDLGPVRHRT